MVRKWQAEVFILITSGSTDDGDQSVWNRACLQYLELIQKIYIVSETQEHGRQMSVPKLRGQKATHG